VTPTGVFWVTVIIVLLGAALAIAIVAKVLGGIIELARTKVCDACKSRVPNGATKCRACGSAV